MRTRSLASLLGWLSLTLISAPAWSAVSGSSGGQMLSLVSMARPAAMANAFSAVTGDPASMFANPAGLAYVPRPQAAFTHQEGVVSDSIENLSAAFLWPQVGVVGLALGYHAIAPLSDAGAGQDEVQASDLLGQVSFGGSASQVLMGLTYGFSLKVLSSTLGKYHANALALDLGTLWQIMPELELGLAVRNLGTAMKFIEEADPLPLETTLSGRVNLLSDDEDKLFVAADLAGAAATMVRLGTEYRRGQWIALRAGYTIAPDSVVSGLCFGAGFTVPLSKKLALLLDYAYQNLSWGEGASSGKQFFTLGIRY